MVLDSKFKLLNDHFGITQASDWSQIYPQEVLAVEGVAEKTLNHLRLHLANDGITLRDDMTPVYWQENLSAIRGATAVSPDQKAKTLPFTVLIDKAEQLPFSFKGFKGDSRDSYRPLIVPTEVAHLGPANGDYTIKHLNDRIRIERKGLGDVISTVLSIGDRKEQFERTLGRLSETDCAAVVIECNHDAALAAILDPRHPSNRNSTRKPAVRAKSFNRQVLRWCHDYRVPWIFCKNPRMAERQTFNLLRMAWRDFIREQKHSHQPTTEDI